MTCFAESYDHPANIYLFKVNNRNIKKLSVIRNNENTMVLVFLLLTLTYFAPFSGASVVYFEQVSVSWVYS